MDIKMVAMSIERRQAFAEGVKEAQMLPNEVWRKGWPELKTVSETKTLLFISRQEATGYKRMMLREMFRAGFMMQVVKMGETTWPR